MHAYNKVADALHRCCTQVFPEGLRTVAGGVVRVCATVSDHAWFSKYVHRAVPPLTSRCVS